MARMAWLGIVLFASAARAEPVDALRLEESGRRIRTVGVVLTTVGTLAMVGAAVGLAAWQGSSCGPAQDVATAFACLDARGTAVRGEIAFFTLGSVAALALLAGVPLIAVGHERVQRARAWSLAPALAPGG